MSDFSLTLPGEELKKEIVELEKPTPKEVNELEQAANSYVQKILNVDIEDPKSKIESSNAIEKMGFDLQKESSHKSQMLQMPIRELSQKSGDGNQVANTLVDLKMQVEELNPNNIDFTKKGLFKIFSPIKKYFAKYEKAEVTIQKIVESLDNGKEMLRRDNITLEQDQIDMRTLTKKLEKTIKMAELMDNKFNYELDKLTEQEKINFIKEEILFPLRQRIMDLQQQLAVNQQGILAIEVLKRNNKELIRGVDRAKLVTINALKVAVIVAKALADQKLVLDKITALNQTTSNLIASTAERLKVQGTEIHKQASENMLDAEKLKAAFNDINQAMDEISKFRQEALPKMAITIKEFDELTQKGEKKILELEKGNKTKLV